MSTYELDDDLVRRFVKDGLTEEGVGLLANALNVQLPAPVPLNIGAVVRTENRIFVRTAGLEQSHCWWDFTNHVGWFTDEQLGRVVEVLSEGVDL